MSKTYAARLADRIRKTLPTDTEFVIEDMWLPREDNIIVRHPNGVHTFIAATTLDKRVAVTEDMVQATLRSVAYKLLPKHYDTPKWQTLNKEAHNAWVAQTGIEL